MGFLDKDGLSALWSKITAKLDGKRDKVIAVRKYENIIATANTQAAGTFYMIAVKPDSFYEPCTVRFRVHAEINPAMTNANRLYYNEDTTSEMIFTGTGCNYRNTNALYSTSYRPYYYLSAYRLTKAGFDAGKPIYIGVSLYNATEATTTTLKRDITVELLEVIGGTAELLEEPVLQSAFYSATNYNGISNTDATSAGTKQTGDNNSIDRLYYGSYSPLAGASLYGTQVVLSSDGITFYSICTSRSTATNKTCTSQGFLPEHLMYYSGSGTVAKDKRLATYSLYDALPFDFRYSANCGSTLTAHKPVYLVCTFNKSEKLYYLDTTKWYTQDVPTSEDGKYYILLGYSYGAYSIYIKPTHPVYVYKDGVFTTVERVSAGNSGGSSEPEVFTIGGVLQGANNGITFGTVQQTDEEIKEAFENDKRCVFYLEYEDGIINLPITDYKKDQIITLMAESYFGLTCEKWFSGSMVDVDIDTMQNSALGRLYVGAGFFAIIKQTFNIVAFNGAYSALEGTPDALPNPKALTINGQIYDGSKAVEVDVSGGNSNDWEKIIDYTTTEEAEVVELSLDGIRDKMVNASELEIVVTNMLLKNSSSESLGKLTIATWDHNQLWHKFWQNIPQSLPGANATYIAYTRVLVKYSRAYEFDAMMADCVRIANNQTTLYNRQFAPLLEVSPTATFRLIGNVVIPKDTQIIMYVR